MPDGSYRDLGPRSVGDVKGATMKVAKGGRTTMRAGRRSGRKGGAA